MKKLKKEKLQRNPDESSQQPLPPTPPLATTSSTTASTASGASSNVARKANGKQFVRQKSRLINNSKNNKNNDDDSCSSDDDEEFDEVRRQSRLHAQIASSKNSNNSTAGTSYSSEAVEARYPKREATRRVNYYELEAPDDDHFLRELISWIHVFGVSSSIMTCGRFLVFCVGKFAKFANLSYPAGCEQTGCHNADRNTRSESPTILESHLCIYFFTEIK